MGKSHRDRPLKNCDGCGKPETTLYRIRLHPKKPWVFTCTGCQSKLKIQPLYQYGGTWKLKKRH